MERGKRTQVGKKERREEIKGGGGLSKHTHEYKNDEAMKCGRKTRYDLHSKSGGLFTRESRNFRGREGGKER